MHLRMVTQIQSWAGESKTPEAGEQVGGRWEALATDQAYTEEGMNQDSNSSRGKGKEKRHT